MRFSVLGCGRWGSFIAWYLNQNGHRVCIWGREDSQNLARLRSGVLGANSAFPKEIETTEDISYAVDFAEAIAISISSQNLRGFMGRKEFAPALSKPMILCMKGLEEDTGRRLSQIACEFTTCENIAVWLGPGHVEYFLAGLPNCMVIDAYNEKLKVFFVDALKGNLIRFYYGTDMIGNEVGAAAKNVIGIAAGMLDGLAMPSLKGALMSRGAREISRLIDHMGGNPMSAYGLAHLGDYEATVFSKFSRNRQYGELFVKGEKLGVLAEGVSTAKALRKLSEMYDAELPICSSVYDMLYLHAPLDMAIENLLLRDLKHEF